MQSTADVYPPAVDPLRSRQLAAPSVPAYSGLSPTSSRGPSLDGAASLGSGNPFRDPSLNTASRDASLDLSSRDPSFDHSFASIHSGSPSVSPPLSAVNSRAQQAPSQGRPGLATRPSEVSRQLADAFKEDLPRVSEEASPSPPVSRASSTNKESKSGLWSQFRTGSGWFAPLVEADQPMTREERAAAEKERIEKLKEGRASNSSRRPGLMKRMSSGVEMGFARSRSGSQSTIRKG
ncbi:hypothetical protein JCM9279_005151 [Rhodotorula babjevae]